MSALPFTPLTITPRPAASPHALPPSQREGAGGRADSPAPLFPSSPVPLFSPDETTAAAIINDFAAQDLTLRDIADNYETTLESLTLWLARPDIKERLFALESACAARARLVVANNLAAIANKLLHLLTESKLDHESIHRVPAATHHAFAARMQSRESARKTANLLLRIARYVPPSPTAPPPRAPSPRSREVGGEDRLAKGQATCQATEGSDAYLNADAVQAKTAATPLPTTTPTRQRGSTNAPCPPTRLAHREEVPESTHPADATTTPHAGDDPSGPGRRDPPRTENAGSPDDTKGAIPPITPNLCAF
ncbi:MAG TPA: hypothetical protein VF777_02370 [Phycisphaerales bacterium]